MVVNMTARGWEQTLRDGTAGSAIRWAEALPAAPRPPPPTGPGSARAAGPAQLFPRPGGGSAVGGSTRRAWQELVAAYLCCEERYGVDAGEFPALALAQELLCEPRLGRRVRRLKHPPFRRCLCELVKCTALLDLLDDRLELLIVDIATRPLLHAVVHQVVAKGHHFLPTSHSSPQSLLLAVSCRWLAAASL